MMISIEEADAQAPTVAIGAPSGNFTVAVGDSVLLEVDLRDNSALASLELSGFAFRGDAELGTQEKVARFEPKTVDLAGSEAAVMDTTISRFLVATDLIEPESPIYLVAVASDTAGNISADTVTIAVGGPRVEITSPEGTADVRAGTQLSVQISGGDQNDGIRWVSLSASGAFAMDTTLTFSPFPAEVDTAVILSVPNDAEGELRLVAGVVSGTSVDATSRTVSVNILPTAADQTPPNVYFSVDAPERAERTDSFSVRVSATDNTLVDSVGVSLLAINQSGGSPDTTVAILETAGDESTFRFALSDLGVTSVADTFTLRVEVTGLAVDTAGNCGAATAAGTSQSLACLRGPGGTTRSETSGSRLDILLVRGLTVPVGFPGDRMVDIVSDGGRVFLSNHSRNRVEVLDIATGARSGFRVGSEPWGLAVSPDSTTLYVANSGGTNISVVDLAAGTLQEDGSRRIYTPNVQLFQVDFSRDSVETGAGGKRSVIVPSSVTEYDYSDRPQFIAQTASGTLFYSTKPTGTAPDGTIRRITVGGDVEFFVDYAAHDQDNSLVIVNGLKAALVEGDPNQLSVISKEGVKYVGFVNDVEAQLAAANSETYFDYFLNLGDVGLQDTTFVAVSGDHQTVAFGEGAANPGRVILYQETGADTLVRSGDTDDLIGNAAERVIGLALNEDGTLGAARGNQAYFFTPDLRLQGVAETGDPSGGIALHPEHANYPSTPDGDGVAFVSGIDENGSPYIDVLDTFNFVRRKRLFLRAPITGPIIAISPPAGSPAVLQVYAVTSDGVVHLDLTAADIGS